MKVVKASNGAFFFLVDDEDYNRVAVHNWTHTQDGYYISHPFGKRKLLHRFILNYDGPLDIDHINRQTFDNRKENLRIVTRSINNLNRESGLVKTRILSSLQQVFDARIQVNKTTIHLGTFRTHKRAKLVAERARLAVLNGATTVEALKRSSRWDNVKRVLVKI